MDDAATLLEIEAIKQLKAQVLRSGGRAVIGIGDPDVMARLPFTPHGFTIRPVGEIAAVLENSGLQVEQRRIDEKPMPRYLFIGRRN